MKIPGAGNLRIILIFSGPDSVSSVRQSFFSRQGTARKTEDCAYFTVKPDETVYGMG